MTVGKLQVDLTLNAEPFKLALADVTSAVQELEDALARLNAAHIEIGCSEPQAAK
jgi:hypothetical protein